MQLKTLFYAFILTFLFFGEQTMGQTATQTVKGTVRDAVSQQSLPFATVILDNSNPPLGAVTDENGVFRIENVPVGRYTFTANYVGYKPAAAREILVGSGKEVSLSFELEAEIGRASCRERV